LSADFNLALGLCGIFAVGVHDYILGVSCEVAAVDALGTGSADAAEPSFKRAHLLPLVGCVMRRADWIPK